MAPEQSIFGKDGVVQKGRSSDRSKLLKVDQQFRDGKATILNSIFRYHGRPFVLVFAKQVTESGEFVNHLFYYVSLYGYVDQPFFCFIF